MGISKVVLLHELKEADIAMDSQSLAAFIHDDLSRDNRRALCAYLKMAQAMAASLEKPRYLEWFGRKSNFDPNWEWCSFEHVQESSKMMEFIGTAQRIGTG
jgi:hypothetical protein